MIEIYRQRETRRTGKLESRKAGELESWKAGKLESWKAGKLDSWTAGQLESWKAGAHLIAHVGAAEDSELVGRRAAHALLHLYAHHAPQRLVLLAHGTLVITPLQGSVVSRYAPRTVHVRHA